MTQMRTLSGFSFTAAHPISGQITFAVNNATNFAPAVQASPVPEPATFVMLLSLVAALSFRYRFGPAHKVRREAHGTCREVTT